MRANSKEFRSAKRKARDFDCAYAKELARIYRERHPRMVDDAKTLRYPSGPNIIDPTPRRCSEVEIGGQRVEIPWDIGEALEWFAMHGTWEKSPADVAKWNAFALEFWYRQKRARGMTRKQAIAELATQTGLHYRPARNADPPKNRGIHADERVPAVPTLADLVKQRPKP